VIDASRKAILEPAAGLATLFRLAKKYHTSLDTVRCILDHSHHHQCRRKQDYAIVKISIPSYTTPRLSVLV